MAVADDTMKRLFFVCLKVGDDRICKRGHALVGIECKKAQEIPMLHDNSQYPGYYIKVNGLNIHYKCLGEGPSVMLLHGVGGDWSQWLANLLFLARHFRVYALDMPGFGLSDPPGAPVGPRWYGAFLNDFMEALAIPDAHVVGHSFGGAVALAFALDFPEKVRKMVIIDSAGLGRLSWKGRALYFLNSAIDKVAGKYRPYKRGGTIAEWTMASRLHSIKPPVMIVWGGRDPYLPLSQARQAQRLIPNCRLRVFECTCHAPHREFADEFDRDLYQFLTEPGPSWTSHRNPLA